MRTPLLAGLFVVALAMPAIAADAKQDFTLINKTGYELNSVFVSPSNSEDWDEDVLGKDVLEDGGTADIEFHRSENTCKWDLKVVYTVDSSSAVWHEIDLCSVSKITIRYNKNTDKTTASYQ